VSTETSSLCRPQHSNSITADGARNLLTIILHVCLHNSIFGCSAREVAEHCSTYTHIVGTQCGMSAIHTALLQPSLSEMSKMSVQFMKKNLRAVSHSSSVSTESTSMRAGCIPWKLGVRSRGVQNLNFMQFRKFFITLLYTSCVKYGLGTSVNAPH